MQSRYIVNTVDSLISCFVCAVRFAIVMGKAKMHMGLNAETAIMSSFVLTWRPSLIKEGIFLSLTEALKTEVKDSSVERKQKMEPCMECGRIKVLNVCVKLGSEP